MSSIALGFRQNRVQLQFLFKKMTKDGSEVLRQPRAAAGTDWTWTQRTQKLRIIFQIKR